MNRINLNAPTICTKKAVISIKFKVSLCFGADDMLTILSNSTKNVYFLYHCKLVQIRWHKGAGTIMHKSLVGAYRWEKARKWEKKIKDGKREEREREGEKKKKKKRESERTVTLIMGNVLKGRHPKIIQNYFFQILLDICQCFISFNSIIQLW